MLTFYCQSTEFVCMCHEFDIALDICTIRDIRRKISAHFNCVVLSSLSLVEHCLLFFAICSFYLHIVYSVLHIFVLLPHVANKLNHFATERSRLQSRRLPSLGRWRKTYFRSFYTESTLSPCRALHLELSPCIQKLSVFNFWIRVKSRLVDFRLRIQAACRTFCPHCGDM